MWAGWCFTLIGWPRVSRGQISRGKAVSREKHTGFSRWVGFFCRAWDALGCFIVHSLVLIVSDKSFESLVRGTTNIQLPYFFRWCDRRSERAQRRVIKY